MPKLPQHFNNVISKLVTKHDRVAIALSGGVDSMSLLHLLNRYNKTQAQDLQITCITVDHGYRPSSSQEALSIRAFIPDRGIRHVISKIQWVEPLHELTNFEELARLKRYELMVEYCQNHGINKLLMGHTLNDQVETFILRLLDNSSIFGLKCMSTRSRLSGGVELVRPLLSIDKPSLYDYCKSEHISWFEDATNKDVNLTRRNRIRQFLIDGNISTGEMLKLMDQVDELNAMIYDKMINLKKTLVKFGDLGIDYRYLSISLNLSKEFFANDDNKILLNRFLWSLNYQISPLANYHYSYSSNLKLFPYIQKFINSSSSSSSSSSGQKFNLLGSLWELSDIDSKFINIKISREPPRSTLKMQLITNDFIFDNRLHITTGITSTNNKKLYISLITQDKLPKLKKFKLEINEPFLKSSKLLNLPCIIDDEDDIIGIPTLAKWSGQPLQFKYELSRSMI